MRRLLCLSGYTVFIAGFTGCAAIGDSKEIKQKETNVFVEQELITEILKKNHAETVELAESETREHPLGFA